MKRETKIVSIISVIASTFLIGCGGGSTSSSSTVGTGYYIDSAVAGVTYVCGSQSGTTDAKGTFTFEKGADCAFSIGDLLLRKVNASALRDKVSILEDNATTAQLLQSLDSDGNAENGIHIAKESASLFREIAQKTAPTDELKLDEIVTKIKNRDSNFKGRFVSKEEAMMHLAQTKAKIQEKMGGMMGNMGNMGDMGSMMGDMNMDAMGVQKSTTLSDFHYIPFSKPLAIPALATYTTDANGTKVFNLDINESTTNFFDGISTKTYGVNAHILGQTIRIHNGDKVQLNYTNNLSVPTTMHGHGMHVPANMDGGPTNDIQAGTTWSAKYTVKQNASTNWYHPHFMHKTAKQVYMGLAGFIIIDDDASDALNLPKEYGVDDLPLAIQDKRFDANGQIDYSPNMMETKMGYKSDVMLVNGIINPFVDVPAKKIRLRLLNGSNASVYKLAFSDKREFKQIAVDNSFLESPVALTSVSLTPGERAEVIVDLTNKKGESFTLVNTTTGAEIMKFNVTLDPTTISTIPDQLTTLVHEDPTTAVRTRKFVLNMAKGDDGKMHMAINGKLMDINRMDEYVPKDEVEVWEITNNMGMTHNFHIHGTHFFPLTRNGEAVPANERGYKDVVAMPGHSTVRVIVKMSDFVDENTGYMYHCHFLEHEDDDMMGQFAVTDARVEVNNRP